MDDGTIKKSLDFFYPFFKEECFITFYGGEPLLAYRQIREIIGRLEEKNSDNKVFRFSMTTNGSLLTDEIMGYLDHYKFSLKLSFDGVPHDTGRAMDTHEAMIDVIKGVPRYPGITFSTNSVFTPETVRHLSDSIRLIVELGVRDARFSFSSVLEWDETVLAQLQEELTKSKNFLLSYYKKTGAMPVREFQTPPARGLFACAAAQTRMAVTPEGNIWGCYLFPYFFKDKMDTRESRKYFLGHIDAFARDYKTILEKQLLYYAGLHQKNFYTDDTFCYECVDLEKCGVCPVNAAYSGSVLVGKIPVWHCRINKLKNRARVEFLQELESLR